jgi:hypothetical protein
MDNILHGIERRLLSLFLSLLTYYLVVGVWIGGKASILAIVGFYMVFNKIFSEFNHRKFF